MMVARVDTRISGQNVLKLLQLLQIAVITRIHVGGVPFKGSKYLIDIRMLNDDDPD